MQWDNEAGVFDQIKLLVHFVDNQVDESKVYYVEFYTAADVTSQNSRKHVWAAVLVESERVIIS